MWLVVIGLTWGVAWGVLALAHGIHPWLGWLVEVWMIFTALAGRCLAQSAMAVARPLQAGDLAESRHKLSWIVGRDTFQLQPAQINRAVVETVAGEHGGWHYRAALFPAPRRRAWPWPIKAVNTLDSMVGYKHEKYRAIGMVSARLDDVANFLPARLSWLLLSLAAVCYAREDGARALRTGWRDRYQHSSPNCAWPEATVAGALGDPRLGGPDDYFGQRVEKPWIGDAVRDIAVDDISRTIRLMWVASSLALALFIGVRYGWSARPEENLMQYIQQPQAIEAKASTSSARSSPKRDRTHRFASPLHEAIIKRVIRHHR